MFYGAYPERKIPIEFFNQRVLVLVARSSLNSNLVTEGVFTLKAFILALAAALGKPIGSTPVTPPLILGFPETVVKIVAPPLTQFSLTCHWLPFQDEFSGGTDFESEDPTDGEDEYPEPNRNSPENPYFGNPRPDDPNPDSDARDFPVGPVPGTNEGAGNRIFYDYKLDDGPWNSVSIAGAFGFPGVLAASQTGNLKKIEYIDNSGVKNNLNDQFAPIVISVRKFRVRLADGSFYRPFVDSKTI